MANSQTYIDGFSPDQVTTLSNVQGAGLKIPENTSNFINDRSPGKIERLFNATGNSNVLYSTNKPNNLYLKGPLSEDNGYINIEYGQTHRLSLTDVRGASARDGLRVSRFLSSNAGAKFILNQVILQGQQVFDETKVYNPASPIIAALRLASFGALDRPTRHIDTSNIIGGLLGATGLSTIARNVSGLFGGGEAQPSPPRSTVASEASNGFGVATFSSFLGGADKTDKVLSPLARQDVRGLLRGQTATNAYNSPRYAKLMNAAGGNFFDRLLTGVGKYMQNNTIVGGIVPPKQPWAANYRADEQTYDLYLNSGKLFNPDMTGISSGGILTGVLNSLGFGKKANYSLAVNERFYNDSKNAPNFNRSIIISRNNRNGSHSTSTNEVGIKTYDGSSEITTKKIEKDGNKLKYTDLIVTSDDGLSEVSDQLLNYKALTDKPKDFDDTFTDTQNQQVKDISDTLSKLIINITGNGTSTLKYDVTNDKISNSLPLQFSKFNLNTKQFNGDVGFNTIGKEKYEDRFKNNNLIPTIKDRQIMPTNDVDYVNSLEVLSQGDFDKYYGNSTKYKAYGPDIIKFYFYDIVNQKYIPFNATVKGIQDINSADWEQVDYLGRPDKLFNYKGFTREINFSFVVNAHSVKELMPMWKRINYLTGLIQPSNYTSQQYGGFMVPPMTQLTVGDFYKNHYVIIRTCNISIPEDASWETLPEEINKSIENWYWGPNGSFKWGSGNPTINNLNSATSKGSSIGRVAQLPMTTEITMQMSVLSKDRAEVGRSLWGDAIVSTVDEIKDNRTVKKLNYTDKSQEHSFLNTFSQNIRTDKITK